jgi:hypothetical protein
MVVNGNREGLVEAAYATRVGDVQQIDHEGLVQVPVVVAVALVREVDPLHLRVRALPAVALDHQEPVAVHGDQRHRSRWSGEPSR